MHHITGCTLLHGIETREEQATLFSIVRNTIGAETNEYFLRFTSKSNFSLNGHFALQ